MRALASSLTIAALFLACSSDLPGPPREPPPRSAFADVPYPPPPARVERVPDRPTKNAVWIDGSWVWTGTRWRWKDGGWYEPPGPEVKRSDWALIRHDETRLLYASAAWRDRKGDAVPGPKLLASATMQTPSSDEDGGSGTTDGGEGMETTDGEAVAPVPDAGTPVPTVEEAKHRHHLPDGGIEIRGDGGDADANG